MKCTLCTCEELDKRGEGTHTIWVCPECPYIGFEYYNDESIDILKETINQAK